MNSRQLAVNAATILNNKKAIDVVALDITEKSSFADYFVIASGGSERQVETLSDEIEEKLAQEGLVAKSIEGKRNTGWILMDYGDVIINIFTIEQRDRYKIERIWSDCNYVPEEEFTTDN